MDSNALGASAASPFSPRTPASPGAISDQHRRYAEAANMAYLGLYALQHRGQRAGHRLVGAVRSTCPGAMALSMRRLTRFSLGSLVGPTAVGHVRYSTAAEAGSSMPARS